MVAARMKYFCAIDAMNWKNSAMRGDGSSLLIRLLRFSESSARKRNRAVEKNGFLHSLSICCSTTSKHSGHLRSNPDSNPTASRSSTRSSSRRHKRETPLLDRVTRERARRTAASASFPAAR